jgi:outer membrane protein assembly factor BamB
VFVGEGHHFLAIDAGSGHTLFNYITNGIVYGGSSISNGAIYFGNNGGTLYAFGF